MRKRCKRKVWALVDPIQHAKQGACITADALLDHLKGKELAAIAAFREGRATREDWNVCTDLANMAQSMSKDGLGVEVMPWALAGEKILVRAASQIKEGKAPALDADEVSILSALQEYHHLQRSAIPRSEYERALKRCHGRILSQKGTAVVVTL